MRSTYEFGAFCLDPAEHRLLRDGRSVPLTPKMFELLRVLVENAGHLVETERLLNEVWADTFVQEANLTRGISVLRKALGETATERYIETVPKRGYRFVAPIRGHALPAEIVEGIGPPVGGGHADSRAGWKPRRFWMPAAVIAAGAMLTIAAVLYAILGRGERRGRVTAPAAAIHRQLTFTGKEMAPALSPDGRRIAYVSTESPVRKVMVQGLDGTEPAVVFSAPEAGALRWSPESSELMFWARGQGADGLYIAPHSGGSARRVSRSLFVAGWSPDGSTIALAMFREKKILFLDRAGEVQRSIALQGTQEWMWDLDWSVDGRLLFVVDDHDGRPAIWTIRSDGSGQTKVFTGATEILAARWAPGAEAIYFFTRINQTISVHKLHLRPGQGPAVEPGPPLISGLEADDSFGISADATRLVYARAPYFSNLWIVEAADSGNGQGVHKTQLTNGTSVIERPRVSPDGQSIVFNMGYESRANLYTMPATGGTPRQLTFLNAFSLAGVWSPNGRMVAFASTEGGKARIWVVNADGSSPRPLPAGDMSENYDIAWAPGPDVLYQKAGYGNIYVIDPETHRQRLLVKESSGEVVSSAVYAPDGKRIAMFWNHRPTVGLWVTDSHNSFATLFYRPPRPFAPIPVPIGWSSDGTSVYALDGKRAAYRGVSVPFWETTTEAKILRVPLHGGPPTAVLHLPFEEIGSVAMFPDGRRFVCSVYSSRSDVWVVENFDNQAEPGLARRID